MKQEPNEWPRSEGENAQPPACSEPQLDPFTPGEAWPEPGRGMEGPDPCPSLPEPQKRIGFLEGHLPDIVDPLDPRHPDTAFTETRRLRHDGWNPEKIRRFLERFAECGIFTEACLAAGMSARAAYNLRDRDPLFAAGCEAAAVMSRTRLSDQAYSRSMNGVVERIYKDGVIVAEKHKYDNRLTMATLARLDARIDRAEAMGAPHLRLVARWDEYLDALAGDRPEDAQALLDPPVPSAVEGPEPEPEALKFTDRTDLRKNAGDSELHELHLGEEPEEDEDRHAVWEDGEGWWTDYPPPEDFDGDEEGDYGDHDYRRTLSDEEQAVIDAELAEEKAEARAKAEAQRRAWFGFDAEPPAGSEPGAQAPREQREESASARTAGREANPTDGGQAALTAPETPGRASTSSTFPSQPEGGAEGP